MNEFAQIGRYIYTKVFIYLLARTRDDFFSSEIIIKSVHHNHFTYTVNYRVVPNGNGSLRCIIMCIMYIIYIIVMCGGSGVEADRATVTITITRIVVTPREC